MIIKLIILGPIYKLTSLKYYCLIVAINLHGNDAILVQEYKQHVRGTVVHNILMLNSYSAFNFDAHI